MAFISFDIDFYAVVFAASPTIFCELRLQATTKSFIISLRKTQWGC